MRLDVFRNSEAEKISIETIPAGTFAGQKALVIWDDDDTAKAPMLLDDGLIEWLADKMREMQE